MFASQVIGHGNAKRLLELALQKPHHAYLLVGPSGVGVHGLAEAFVRALLQMQEKESLYAHPDLVVLEARDSDTGERVSGTIPVEAVRHARARMAQRPQSALRCVAYVPYADRLNEAGTNALLKSLEEPQGNGVYVLAASDASRIPATVKSRVITISLGTVSLQEIDVWLASRGVADAERRAAVHASAGRPAWALRWIQDASWRAEQRDAELLVERLLDSTCSAGSAVAAMEPVVKRCESSDDAASSWREALGLLRQALSSSLLIQTHHEYPSSARTLHVGHALMAAEQAIGGPISPRLWLEFVLTRAAIGALPAFPRHTGRRNATSAASFSFNL
jgi:hypothetical protein